MNVHDEDRDDAGTNVGFSRKPDEDERRDGGRDHSAGDAPRAAVGAVRIGELPAQDHTKEIICSR